MVRAAFATLPQDPVRFEGTVRENLDPLGERRRQHQRRRHRHANDAGNDDEALVEMLTKVGIWDVVSAQGGLDASFEDLGLSHGQQQLFALARALLRLRQPPVSGSGEGGHVGARSHSAPKMLLLDEATSSLDMDTERAVRQVLREELGEEVTVVEVAHKLEALVDTDGVGGCDIVVVMHEGRIIETGAPRELLGKEGSAFRDLWEGRGRLKR